VLAVVVVAVRMQQLLETQGAEELVVVAMADMQLLEQMETLTPAVVEAVAVLLVQIQDLRGAQAVLA
jgi:hypothetical protein